MAETPVSGEVDDFPIVKDLKVTNKEETFTSENGGVISLDDKIKIEIPAGSLKEETTFYIYHGFALDELGNDKYNESNRQLLTDGVIDPLDIFEVIMTGNNFKGSMKIEMAYDQKFIDDMNIALFKVVTGFDGFHENELGIFYMDKKGGRWISFNNIVDEENNKISINSQYPGIYALAIKPEAFARLGKYMQDNPGSLNHDAIQVADDKNLTDSPVSCGGKSIAPDYTPGDIPVPGGDGPGFTGRDSSCSKAGAHVDASFRGAFNESCYWHDWCYRYGNWTYSYGKQKCDSDFLQGNYEGCKEKFLRPMGQAPSEYKCKVVKNVPYPSCGWEKCKYGVPCYKCEIKRKDIELCKYNPLYAIYLRIKALAYYPCKGFAYAMYKAVRWAPEAKRSYKKEYSGCNDYKNKGVKCELARIFKIKIKSDNKQVYYPDNSSIALEAKIAVKEKGLGDLPITVSWKVEDEHGNSHGNLSWDSSSDLKYVKWYIDSSTPLGFHKITATLRDNGRAISSKSKEISVVNPEMYMIDQAVSAMSTALSSMRRGKGSFRDIGEKIGADNDGNIYITYTKTFEKIIRWTTVETRRVKKKKKTCKKINLGFGKIKYKCKTKTYYVNESYTAYHSRKEYYTKKFLSKFSSNNTKLWDKEIAKLPVKSLKINNNGEIFLTRKNEVVIFNSSGSLLDRIDSIPGEIEDLFVDDSGYYVISRDIESSEISIQKFDIMGMIAGEPEVIFNNAEYGSAKIKDNGIYITAYKMGDESKLYVAKIDLDCNILLFADFNVTGEATLANIDTDDNGEIYLTGYAPGKFIDPELTGEREAFLMSLDYYGEKKWIKKLSRFEENSEIKIDIDNTNEIILTGSRRTVSQKIIGIVKYDINGNFLHVKTIDIEAGEMTHTGSIMLNNNLYITGIQKNSNIDRDWFYLRTLEY